MDIVNSATRNMHAVGNTTEPNTSYTYNAIGYLFSCQLNYCNSISYPSS